MKKLLFLPFIMMLIAIQPTLADEEKAQAALKEVSATVTAIAHVSAIHDANEDIAFWQAVAIQAAIYGRRIEYSSDGETTIAATYRLFNSLEESEIETKRAAAALSRSHALSDDIKSEINSLNERHLEFRAIAERVRVMLDAEKTDEAAEIYWDEVISLRRDINRAAQSVVLKLNDQIKTAVRAAR